jgi:hypothetical protein
VAGADHALVEVAEDPGELDELGPGSAAMSAARFMIA